MSLTRVTAVLCVIGSTASGAAAQGSAAAATAKGGSVAKAAAKAPARVRYIVAPTGNEARYRVREQLVGVDLPNDAIGVTQAISGTLVLDPSGTVVTDSSRVTVNVTGLKSDKDRRDNYIKRRTIETEKFPTVELVPTAFRGLSSRPGDNPSSFELVADLTVHGVTRPTTWKVTARSEGTDLVGSAVTAFTFKDFSLDQPHVPVVLSVADTIKLEYDFHFTPAGKTP